MPSQTRTAGDPTDPIPASAFGFEQARHLLWRAGFGGTPDQIQTLVGWGPEKAVDHLLDVQDVPYEEVKPDTFDKDIMRPYSMDERRMYRRAQAASDEDTLARIRARRQEAERSDRQQVRQVQQWWLRRMIESPRPLEEKMTLFFHGHFATSYRTIEDSYHMFAQNQLFRRHAVGNFGELLLQVIRDPAMLAYLDNDESRRDRPNENLARELMELFSLGVGAYSERDIKEGARALTGYTFRDDEFVFDRENHDGGAKSILGRTAPLDGDGFVRAILEHRACARFIARKLYRFFAGDIPLADEGPADAERVVRALADTMGRNRYELRPVLRQLLLSRHFYDPAVMGEQIKSPVQLVVGAVRSLRTPVRDMGILVDALNLMGQNILFPPSVKGWDGGRAWISTSTIYVRQNILCFLLVGKLPVGYDALADAERYDPSPLLAELARVDPAAATDPARVADYITRFALPRPAPQHRAAIDAFLQAHAGGMTPEVLTGLLLLLTATPEYQLC